MTKRVELNETTKGRILAINPDAQFDTIAVFEAVVLTTLPLSKRGTIYDKARVSANLLSDMAAALNSGKERVPLHTLHQQGYELPIGRLFYAETRLNAATDESELIAQFWVDGKEVELISKLDSGSIDEVSVGLQSTHATCSECGFDFMGADADFEHLWTATCPNDHTMGQNGAHARLSGLTNWYETSLVSRGASKGTKILGKSRQILSAEATALFHEKGRLPEFDILFASTAQPKSPPSKGNTKMDFDFNKFTAELTEAKVTAATSKRELESLTAQLTAANAELTELKTKHAEIAKLDAIKAESEAAVKYIRSEAARLSVASGKTFDHEKASVVELSAFIDDTRKSLTDALTGDGEKKPTKAEFNSTAAFFKLPK